MVCVAAKEMIFDVQRFNFLEILVRLLCQCLQIRFLIHNFASISYVVLLENRPPVEYIKKSVFCFIPFPKSPNFNVRGVSQSKTLHATGLSIPRWDIDTSSLAWGGLLSRTRRLAMPGNDNQNIVPRASFNMQSITRTGDKSR